MLLFALSSAVIHTINNNDYLVAVDSVDSSFSSLIDSATGTDLLSELKSLIDGSRGVSGLMIFTAIAILIVEVPVIVGRFTLLLGIGWLRILHIVVSSFADSTLVLKAWSLDSEFITDIGIDFYPL